MAAKDNDSDDLTTEAVEAPDLESTTAPRHGFFTRLYTGTGAFEVIGKRKLWFTISGLIVAVAIASILIRGFTFGIDFEGGTKVSMPAQTASGNVTTQQVEDVFSKTLGKASEAVVLVGSGDSATVQIRSETLDNAEIEELRTALFDAFQPRGPDGKPEQERDQRLGGVGDLGRADHRQGSHRSGGVPGAGRGLHHHPIRALHGPRRAGHAGVRPRRHRRCATPSWASRSPLRR